MDSVRKEISSSDPELCKSVEIRAIHSCDRVLFTALHAKEVFSLALRRISSTKDAFTSTDRWMRMKP